MLTSRALRYILISIAAAGTLSACGKNEGGDSASAPATEEASQENPFAAYYMPAEWGAQIKAEAITADPIQLEAFAVYLKQHPEALANPEIQKGLVALYSCKDNATANTNEIRAPEIQARYLAAFRSFLADTKPEGVIELPQQLGAYDTGTGIFSWTNPATPQPLTVGRRGSLESISCPGSPVYGIPDNIIMSLQNAAVPNLRLNTADADKYLQAHPNRYVNLVLRFTIPATVPATAVQGSNLPDAIGELKEAIFQDYDSKQVLATMPR